MPSISITIDWIVWRMMEQHRVIETTVTITKTSKYTRKEEREGEK